MEWLPVPSPQAQRESNSERAATQHRDEMEILYPWFQKEEEKKKGFSKVTSPDEDDDAAESSEEETTSTSANLLVDGDIEAMLGDLDRARAELATAGEASFDDFKTRVLGGTWLAIQQGIGKDAVQGICRTALARRFCDRRGVLQSTRFNYSEHGKDAPGIIARAWRHRMQYFLNIELSDPAGERLRFTAEHRRAYSEPTEFARLASECSHPPTQQRIAQTRAVFA